MHLLISLFLLLIAIVISRGPLIAEIASVGRWGHAIGLVAGPILFFFLIQSLIRLALWLMRRRTAKVSDDSRSNYASLVITVVTHLASSPDYLDHVN